MKAFILTLICILMADYCLGYSQPIIPNTKKQVCIDGVCGSACSWDGAELFPSENLNQPGKCRMLACSSSFDIRITPCPFDMTGQFEYVNKDNSKLYPECCGRKVPKNRN